MFKYIYKDTFIHALNPMMKFVGIGILSVVIVLFLTPKPVIASFIFAFILLVFGAKISVKQIIKGMLPFILAAFGTIWVQAVFSNTEGVVIYQKGIINLTEESLIRGISLGIRMLTMLLLGNLFAITTEPREMVVSMVNQFKIPYRIAFGMSIALRFVPMIQEEWDTLQAVQRVRTGIEPVGIRGRWKATKNILMPLFLGVIRRSVNIGIAMDSRGFGLHPTRTFLAESYITWRDWAFIALMSLFSIGLFFI